MNKPNATRTETAPATNPIDAALATLDAIETEQLSKIIGGAGDGWAGGGQLGFSPHQMKN